MGTADGAQDELLRMFQAAIAGLDSTELGQLGRRLLDVPRRLPRPELRRPTPAQPATLRIRADLDDARPPIWRRLELRGDLTLDVVHQILQAAFDWTDSHLHRFSLGEHPFHPAAQLFLCPDDVAEGDDHGVPEEQVRLDETLQRPGNQLHYVYDYGDHWELRIRLEKVLPPSDVPVAAVAGSRAAPPEDSGGGTDLAALALAVPDPSVFDLAETDVRVRRAAAGREALPRAAELRRRLAHLPIGRSLTRALDTPVVEPTDAEVLGVTLAFQWFLDRAADGGLPLTSAGYLRPDDVLGASAVVPTAAGWIGTKNREIQTVPVLTFRRCLQHLKLLRKYRGALLLTAKGTRARANPQQLWAVLHDSLVPGDGFTRDASVLLLAATADPGPSPSTFDDVAAGLTELGYGHRGGRSVDMRDLLELDVTTVLENVGVPGRRESGEWHPMAAVLARTALQNGSPG